MPRKKIYENAKTVDDRPMTPRAAAQKEYARKNSIKRVAIDMPEEKINLIKSFAADHGLTMIALFTRAIDYYMQNYESINAADQSPETSAADPGEVSSTQKA